MCALKCISVFLNIAHPMNIWSNTIWPPVLFSLAIEQLALDRMCSSLFIKPGCMTTSQQLQADKKYKCSSFSEQFSHIWHVCVCVSLCFQNIMIYFYSCDLVVNSPFTSRFFYFERPPQYSFFSFLKRHCVTFTP